MYQLSVFAAGRELSKLAIAWQAAAYGSDPAVFTPELMASITDAFLEQKVGGFMHVHIQASYAPLNLRFGFFVAVFAVRVVVAAAAVVVVRHLE